MSSAPEFSVIVPYLDAPLVDRVLLAALEQAEQSRGEVILVGMERTDSVRLDPWRERSDDFTLLKIIDTDRPYAPGTARNKAVEAASSEKFLFIDADAVPQPGWAESLCRALDVHPLVGGAVEFGAASDYMLADNAAAFFDLTPDRAEGETDTICSVNMGIGRELFQRLDGFDEELVTAEDFDLILRARELGIKPYFVPRAGVLHLPGRNDLQALQDHARAWARGSALVRKRRKEPLLPGPLFTPAVMHWLASPLALAAAAATVWSARKSLHRPLGLLGMVYRSRRAWFLQAAKSLREAGL